MSSKQNGFVFGYINPDTDGVCAAIAYSYLQQVHQQNYTPVVFGSVNSETLFVLKYFGIAVPAQVSELPADSPIVIVDTHHKNQLPAILFDQVVEIIDHHPAGNPELFINAKIQNEKVGAAATLIAERIKLAAIIPETNIAGIIAAAIVSNTLNFTAPSTSQRDLTAFAWLKNYVAVDAEFIQAMFLARSDIADKSTAEILTGDYKQFSIGTYKIGISQLEIVGVADFLLRRDLPESLMNIKNAQGIDHIVLNVVDILQHTSTVIAPQLETQTILETAIAAKFQNSIAEFSRILLRKTDFIPQLENILLG